MYYGQISPHEKHVDPESRFAVLQDLLSSSDENLTRLLPENCVDAYDAFKAAYDEMYAMAETEAFADGFSLGLRIGIKCCSKETECEGTGCDHVHTGRLVV